MSRTPRRLMLAVAAFAFGVTAISASVPSSAATAATSAAAASSTTYPVQITAANGTITIPSRPTAIVSMSPTATEMLYAIGAGSQVKAVDSYSDYPKNAPRTKLNADDTQRGGDRRLQARPGGGGGRHDRVDGAAGQVRDTGAVRSGRHRPEPGVPAVRRARARPRITWPRPRPRSPRSRGRSRRSWPARRSTPSRSRTTSSSTRPTTR